MGLGMAGYSAENVACMFGQLKFKSFMNPLNVHAITTLLILKSLFVDLITSTC